MPTSSRSLIAETRGSQLHRLDERWVAGTLTDHAARIRLELEAAGTPIGPTDLLIAAIARRHGRILVTHNVREFTRVAGLDVVDWY